MPRTHPLVVVQTWFLSGELFEMELASDHDASTKLRFVTRDRELYDIALRLEGQDQRIAVDWHWARGVVRMVDAIHPTTKEHSR